MAENSKIEWCDHTVNFWWGCQEVSQACCNCYARTLAKRFHHRIDGSDLLWGQDSQRLVRLRAARLEAFRYQRRAEKEGRRFRVFTNSMSDFFEDRRDLDLARIEALDVIRLTPDLDWLILTKRPGRILDLLGRAACLVGPGKQARLDLADWLHAWLIGAPPPNVWIGATVEDQHCADQRIPELLKVPAAKRFLSCEPLLGPISFRWQPWAHLATGESYRQYLERNGRVRQYEALYKLDWVIVGGESGSESRPMHPAWARGVRDQCAAAGVPFLFKQWGEWEPINQPWEQNNPAPLAGTEQWLNFDGGQGFHGSEVWRMRRTGKARAGRLLDGVEHNGYPTVGGVTA